MGQRIESTSNELKHKLLIEKKQTILKMSTFSNDNQLPSLPLPSLDATLAKYLESTLPFVNSIEYLNTERIVHQFKHTLGPKLDFYLRQKAKKERNWLENYWLDYAYLEWRYPIVPFVNTTGLVVASDLTEFSKIPPNFEHNIQIANISMQIYYFMKFFFELRNETYPVQKSRASTFSMDQFRNLFNSCRIPLVNKDRLDFHFKTVSQSAECPTHLIVIYKYRFFKMNITHENKLLSITEFYNQIEWIMNRYGNEPNGIGIGALTADYRDDWARNRQYLIDLSKQNEKCFKFIETSVIVINLDDCIVNSNDELGKLGICGDPKNRYFDKSYQSIVSKNGQITSNVEHSPFDGMVSTSMVTYYLDGRKRDKLDLTQVKSFESRSNLEEPQELQFVYDSKIEQEIHKSCEIFAKNSNQIEMKELLIQRCNKDIIKSFKINPDTFTQVCMQLAYFQLHNKPAPTYETSTTRQYFHGRTETVRSCTWEAIQFCKEITNRNLKTRLNDKELLDLFKKACQKHDKLMSEARENAGCDRHLLGLRMIARELDLDLPEIYKDPVWKKSGGDGNFVISSSCVGFTNSLGCCSAMCQNGYAQIYCFSDHGVAFALTRFTDSNETDLNKIADSLDSAFAQVQELFKINSKL